MRQSRMRGRRGTSSCCVSCPLVWKKRAKNGLLVDFESSPYKWPNPQALYKAFIKYCAMRYSVRTLCQYQCRTTKPRIMWMGPINARYSLRRVSSCPAQMNNTPVLGFYSQFPTQAKPTHFYLNNIKLISLRMR